MENIHPSCLKCTSRFFSPGQLGLTFSCVVLEMAGGDFHCRDGKRRVRARREAAGQSACHPRRWGGQEMRAVRIMVVGRWFAGAYVWRVARREYYFCGGPFYFSRSAKFGVFSLTAFFETFQDDPVFGTRRKDTAST